MHFTEVGREWAAPLCGGIGELHGACTTSRDHVSCPKCLQALRERGD
tara:strand:+ start:458 stop:598 length:141 start_codon:yes stop_codon:yes gene_type:complete